MLARVREIKPDMVAMSIMTFNLLDALRTAKVLKLENPSLKVCLRGTSRQLISERNSQPAGNRLCSFW